MMGRLLALLPWMVLAGVAHGQARSADVLYTHHDSVPQTAYRVGDECFLSAEALRSWGWKVTSHGHEAEVEAEGKSFTLSARTIAGRDAYPIRQAVENLGGLSEWLPSTDTLQIYSILTSVSAQAGHVSAEAPLAFQATPFYLADPGRVVIDFAGVRLSPKTQQNLEPGARAFQYRPNVVRVIYDSAQVPNLVESAFPETRNLDVTIVASPTVQQVIPTPPPAETPVPTPTQITGDLAINVTAETDSTTSLSVPLLGQIRGPAQFAKPDPDTLEVTLPFVAAQLPLDFKLNSSAIEEVTSRKKGWDTVLTFKLARAMGAQVASDASGVRITLFKPKVGDGKLTKKVIVVDPGHGGHDRGANSGGVNEKDLNLAIGKQLARKLAQAGATVILTRQTDVFIPLGIRSDISNRQGADFFISCHINSTGGSGSQSGTITFHHEGNATGRLLAECIQHEIAQVNGIPNKGVWSDRRIYRSGFAVLRATRAPAAVLIEMGFINHPRDRKRMVTADFQDVVTSAVVKGVRVFLGESIP